MKKTTLLIILMVILILSVGLVNAATVRITEGENGFGGNLSSYGYFGQAVANIGDIDNDGVEDIVVGEQLAGNIDGHGFGGVVWTILLNNDGTVKSEIKIGDGIGGLPNGTILEGGDISDRFGFAVAGIGDFDNDGVEDIAVSELWSNYPYYVSNLWLLYLNPNGSVKSYVKNSMADLNLNRSAAASSLYLPCQDIASIGDLDGDGVTDLAIGTTELISAHYYGGVVIAFMNSNGTFKNHTYIKQGEAGFSGLILPESWFGLSVGNIGDLDNDGVTDLVVGEPGNIYYDERNGSAWILFLNSDGTVKNDYEIDDSSPVGVYLGDVAADNLSKYFGYDVATDVGDLNGDNIEDIIVSAPRITHQAFVIYLNIDGSVKDFDRIYNHTSPFYPAFQGEYPTGLFYGLDMIGDLDNDGFKELLIGAYSDEVGGLKKGAAYVISGVDLINATPTTECSDSIDNDGDGFTDYPADPSCTSYDDDSEAPYDYFQCNDGIDNDGDGWIDMADPYCSSEADNSELPYNQPFTGDDDCFVAAGCLLYDSVPYSDSIPSHGWYMFLEQSRISGYQGGYSVFIDGYDNETETLSTVDLRKDITNPNIYDNVTAEIIISFLDKVDLGDDITNVSFGISLLNENGSEVIALLLNISTLPANASYDLVAEVYVMNSTTVNYVGQAFMENSLDYGLLRFNFWVDQVNGLFNFNYTDSVGLTQTGDYLVSNVAKIETVAFLSNINSQDVWIYMNVVDISGDGNFTTECSDGIDNDGDGWADYPADPSCSSAGDDSESPFDYTECNNGIDDDMDGFIDMADPRCNHPTDPTEFPSDYSQQDETECLAEESCLFYEQFPYTDSINLHGWEGNIAVFVIENVFGSNRLDFDNLGYIGFDTFHNITNENTYSNVRVQFDTFVNNIASTTEYFYIILEDYFDKDVLNLKYELVPLSETTQIVNIYYWNTTAYELIIEGSVGDDEDSKIQMIMDFDQVLKTWDFTVNYATGSSSSPDDFAEWSDVLANKVYKIRFENGNFNSANWDFWIDNILISGIDTEGVSGSCDTWKLPYYLVENFNGYLSNCEWVTTHSIWTAGNLSVTEDIDFYSAHKRTDLAEQDNTRYFTMTFDLNIVNIAVIGSTITFRLYDADDFNFVTIFFRDSGDYLWYNDGGTGQIAGMIALNQSFPYKFVIDFIDDEWDIYYNDTKLVTDSDFTNSFANIESLQTFKVTSSDATFNLDNLKIFGSDAIGTPLLPDDELTKIIVNDSIWCGMFYKTNPECVADEDCTTGNCLSTGKCSSFNMKYCDENGYTRGNSCLFAGVSSCFLNSTEKWVVNNFFFVVLIILLIMGAVYLKIMFSRGG